MPIDVRCGCGHQITVSDAMAGKKGRCPRCDAVLSIPSRSGDGASRSGRRGVDPRPGPRRSYASLSVLSVIFFALGIVAFLLCLGIGIFTGVSAFHGGDGFGGPFGLFREYAGIVAKHPSALGIGFIAGGLVLGALCFLLLCAAAQSIKLFVSLERSLVDISEHLVRRGG